MEGCLLLGLLKSIGRSDIFKAIPCGEMAMTFTHQSTSDKKVTQDQDQRSIVQFQCLGQAWPGYKNYVEQVVIVVRPAARA